MPRLRAWIFVCLFVCLLRGRGGRRHKVTFGRFISTFPLHVQIITIIKMIIFIINPNNWSLYLLCCYFSYSSGWSLSSFAICICYVCSLFHLIWFVNQFCHVKRLSFHYIHALLKCFGQWKLNEKQKYR